MFELVVEKHFAAAHFLPEFGGACARLHGHNYRVRVYVRGEQLDRHGLLVDFAILKDNLNRLLERYDHFCLNDLPEFATTPPSTEQLARSLATELAAADLGNARLHRVEVRETAHQAVTYFLSGETRDD
jgi:6-pyruvoyltetrahydropterin/6-carboxytetrahydropterin synthase